VDATINVPVGVILASLFRTVPVPVSFGRVLTTGPLVMSWADIIVGAISVAQSILPRNQRGTSIRFPFYGGII
jgi:hypothetical protein